MESEFLARISRRQRLFLTRTAVLERMSGPLCEAVLELPGSGATLAGLARSNLLLVPLDRRGQWYRYHHLFRDMLLAELERLDPGLIPVLRRRAADWCLDNGLAEEALEYSIAAGDVGTAARLVEELTVPTYREGRVTTTSAVVPLAGSPGRNHRTPDGRGAGRALPRIDGTAGRGRAMGRRGRPLAVRDGNATPMRPTPRHRPPYCGHSVPARGRADARRRRRSRAELR